jgi:hypothetical protein
MALLDKLLGKSETEATITTEVTQDPIKKKTPHNILRNDDIAWETAITGETETVIHSED